ncbi:hypothetical protein GTV32_15050 [Gordonia sp. SID5947]|uniref:hypothetical protein n=1 Tax=Gordonia sp. SID5947 TaxID=2690315 RepID=UPI00136A8719|nr:hypothetical protein [Gordonia sp. SID5947]MYR07537.1 hypothetical protein [Gordonia sp. SID5947]
MSLPSHDADVPLSLGAEPAPSPAFVSDDLRGRTEAGNDRIVRTLLDQAPSNWNVMAATFSLTTDRQTGMVLFATDQASVQVMPSSEAFALVRAQRELAATSSTGPWWRISFRLERSGRLEVDFDHGERPFGPDFLFAPADYRVDFVAYPHREVPLWLAAYVFHEGRQLRTPVTALAAVTTSAGAADNQWPDLNILWARWAAVAAVFAAMAPSSGPSMAPHIGIFESSTNSGSTLVRLPGDRAVLSGGVFDSPELQSAYLGSGDLPDLYAGAPIWVGDSTLNARTRAGMLSFCWWYENGRWYRGESPDAAACAAAVPAVRSTGETARVIGETFTEAPSESLLTVANAFVGAVEFGTLTRTLVETLLPRTQGFDTDAALVSLAVSGHFDDR